MAALQQLIAIEAPGEILSPSGANGYLACGYKWYAKHILKLPDPPTGALTLGSAVHAAIGANFEQKIETKRDLPLEGVRAIYREAWDLMVQGEYPGRHGGAPSLPTEFRDDEDPAALKAQGEALALKYVDEACPGIEPAAVELPVTGNIGGVRVRGYIDLLDTAGRIIDLKTSARKPSVIGSDYKFQVATYRRICPHASGAARVDTLVKTKTPQLIKLECVIGDPDMAATESLYPLVQRGIRGGFFAPNRGSNLCSRKYCSAWRECIKEFGGSVE